MTLLELGTARKLGTVTNFRTTNPPQTTSSPMRKLRGCTRIFPVRSADPKLLLLIALAALALLSCGYHVGGKADLVPKSVETIAVPTFGTVTTKYRLVDILPQQISREFISRTRFKIENNPALADAILKGTINNVIVYPVVSDPTTGKATSIRVVVFLNIVLTERTTGKVLFSHLSWAMHEDYEDAVDPHQFFDESGAAYDRLSRDVARDLVSAVVENF